MYLLLNTPRSTLHTPQVCRYEDLRDRVRGRSSDGDDGNRSCTRSLTQRGLQNAMITCPPDQEPCTGGGGRKQDFS